MPSLCVPVNYTTPAWICQICFPPLALLQSKSFKLNPPVGQLSYFAWQPHLAVIDGAQLSILQILKGCYICTSLASADLRKQTQIPTTTPSPNKFSEKRKKNFMKDFCLYSGPCKMVIAIGYGGHNYLSTQRKIQMSKDSGHLACRGPGQAAVTHQASQAAPLPLQAGSILTALPGEWAKQRHLTAGEVLFLVAWTLTWHRWFLRLF